MDRVEWRVAVALAIGLIMGAERERRKGEGQGRAAAGIRTFGIVALLGAVSFQFGGNIAALVFAGLVASFVLAAYMLGPRTDPGLTSEFALLVAFILGVYAQTQPHLAFALGVVTTAILAFRDRLHGAVKRVLTERELYDLLIFAICAVVILPLVPNRTIGPFDALNLFTLWRLVVVFMAIQGTGHVVRRVIGDRYGLILSGFVSGFISSSATFHAMGTVARKNRTQFRAAVGGAMASTVATFLQMALLVGAANPHLLSRLILPLGAGATISIIAAGLSIVRLPEAAPTQSQADESPLRFRTALIFACLMAFIAVITALLEEKFGNTAALIGVAISSLADAHVAAASLASLSANGNMPYEVATLGAVIALSINSLTKIALATIAGGWRFSSWVTAILALVLAATWTAWIYR